MTLLRSSGVIDDAMASVEQERHEAIVRNENCIVTSIDTVRHRRCAKCRCKFLLALQRYDLIFCRHDHGGGHGDVAQPWSRVERANFAPGFEHMAPVVAGNLSGSPVGQRVSFALQVQLFGDPRSCLCGGQPRETCQTRQAEEVEALVA